MEGELIPYWVIAQPFYFNHLGFIAFLGNSLGLSEHHNQFTYSSSPAALDTPSKGAIFNTGRIAIIKMLLSCAELLQAVSFSTVFHSFFGITYHQSHFLNG